MRSDIFAHMCSVLAIGAALVVGVGCDSKSEDANSEQSRDERQQESSEPAESEPDEAPRPVFETRHERADEVMGKFVDQARRHFELASDPEEATFPGGTDVEWASTDAPPTDGETYRLGSEQGAIETDGDTSSGDPVAEAIGLETGTELPVRIVYRTGGKKGAEATATIRAVADFDPSSEADHTLVQELSVDPETGEVNVFPRLVRDRWR